MIPRIRHLLLDFDGVLVQYRRERRIMALAEFAGCDDATVDAVLYASGLESLYDNGQINTAAYLTRLGAGIGREMDATHWVGTRSAGCRVIDSSIRELEALDAGVEIGILSNNGQLIEMLAPRLLPSLRQRLAGRVLGSGHLKSRKPDPDTYVATLRTFGWNADDTLFLDDLFVNVRAARTLGLQAETVARPRSLRTVLKRYGLLQPSH